METTTAIQATTTSALSPSTTSPDENATLYKKVMFRLIPFLMLAEMVSYLDRTNVSFAYLRFKSDINITDVAYGLGVGLFYIGYLAFEIPSNIALEKIGARLTLTRILILWGLVECATAFVRSPLEFYIARIALGAAEAGFTPGVVLYLTFWFPAAHRARVTALVMTSLCISGIVGGPISGGILNTFNDVLSLKSWQWMFLLEGLPAIILGIVAYYYLNDNPRGARWLSTSEQNMIQSDLDNELQAGDRDKHGNALKIGSMLRVAATDPSIYIASICYFFSPWAFSILNFWGPAIIKQSGVTDLFRIGLLTMLQNIAGVIAMVIIARHSDRHAERRWHFMFCVSTTAIGALCLALFHDHVLVTALGLIIMSIGQYAAFAIFWTIPSTYLSRTAVAVGIATISSLGQVSGIFASWILGLLQQGTGSIATGLYLVALIQVLAGATVIVTFRGKV